jgi:hypothetical protein
VIFNDSLYLIINLFFIKGLTGYPKAHRYNLDGNNTDLVINSITFDIGGGVQLLKKIYVRIEADANPVDKDDRELGTRDMRTTPVDEVPNRRSLATE